MANESTFPTIQDYRDLLTKLVDEGFGDHPAQILIVPSSTLDVLAKHAGATGGRAALMLAYGNASGRQEACLTTVERLKGMPARSTH